MNISRSSRKVVIITLIVLTVLIYCNLFLKVNKTLTKTDTIENKISNTDSLEQEDDFKITFKGKYSDPFNKDLQSKTEYVKEKKKKKQNSTAKIILQGIVDRTALIEIENELYFVQRGDSLANDGMITNVFPDSVIIEFEDKIEILKVKNID